MAKGDVILFLGLCYMPAWLCFFFALLFTGSELLATLGLGFLYISLMTAAIFFIVAYDQCAEKAEWQPIDKKEAYQAMGYTAMVTIITAILAARCFNFI